MSEVETPAATDLDDVKGLVAELKTAVTEMQKGGVDEETVRRIAAEAMTASRRQGTTNPEGFEPDDVVEQGYHPKRGKWARLDAAGKELFMLHEKPAKIARMLRKDPASIQAYQHANDQLMLLGAMTKKDDLTELDYYWDEYLPARQQAMDTKTAGEGKEYVAPVAVSTDIIEKITDVLQILALFPVVTMPTNPFKFPTKGPRKHIALLAEAIEAGTPKAKKLIPGIPSEISLNATKFAGEIVTSKELEEEAAIAILPFLESELVDWLSWDLEDACVNGDTATTHMDADVTVPDDYRKGWDGLRKSTPATAKVDVGGDALTPADLAAIRAKMGRYGLNPRDVVVLLSVPNLYQLIVDPLVTTVDKYGAGATLLSGELGSVWGMPLIATDLIRTDLDATGVRPAAAGTKTITIVARRDAFMHGIRRNTTVQVLTELYAESDQDAVLVTTRQAFGPRWPGEPAIAMGYNVGT